MALAIKGSNHILFGISFLLILTRLSYSQTDRLLRGQVLKDGEELVSAFGYFRLGFFSPQYRADRYLGIWYNKPTDRSTYGFQERFEPPVWVANRNTPISDRSGRLAVDGSDGNLKIFHNNGDPTELITAVRVAGNTSAILLKSGNFVLYEINSDGSTRRELWQSFDYPTDTLLPGMKLGINLQTGKKWFLQSSSDYGSPAEGPYTLGMQPNITNKLIIWKNNQVYWTSGILLNESLNFNFPWGFDYNFSYISNEQERYLNYSVNNDVTSFPKLTLASYGVLGDDSLFYFFCSGFGKCDYLFGKNFPDCGRSYDHFQVMHGFMSEVGFKLNESYDNPLSCAEKCLSNCSCFAYATIELYNGTGCQIWSSGTFIESGRHESATTIHFYVRPKEMKWWQWLIIAVAIALIVCLLLSFGYLKRRKCKAGEEKWWMSLIFVVGVASVAPLLCYVACLVLKKLRAKVESIMNRRKLLQELGDNNLSLRAKDHTMKRDLKIFDFQTIAAATDNFSAANRLGQGGFGPVYKGKLLDGQEIAIKRLSKNSGQGVGEFKNEATLIAKLQHTNLVRLLGCSLQGGERLLVYEYMPNKSLDFFIFDSRRKSLLDWKKRFNIIEGIAQGLLYLHKYSRLRVIHRDLKVSNILLDDQMNPKISDFGMARTFAMNELEANTNRIVGTHGYMSPEYIMNGMVSMKSDVYSFGVLVLEIVTSKKNNSCYDAERPLNLVGYAWKLWNEGKGLELTDTIDDESSSPEQVLRCIHVGLLCVQDRATDRPTMSDVIPMLTNDSMTPPAPKQPAFFINIASDQVPEVTEIKLEVCSVNNVTISEIEAR